MAAPSTSGTVDFKLDILQICEEAFEQAGGELRTGYDLQTSRRSLQLLMLEWANRGINLWTVKEASISLVASTKTYSLEDDAIDVIEGIMRTGSLLTQTDYTLTRISVSTYAQRTNKNTEARPTEMYIDRQNRPTVTFWPVPNDASFTFNYWYLRRIEDIGTDNTKNYDMPERFTPALVAGLASKIALKKPELTARFPLLKALYEEQWTIAAEEDRSKANSVFIPFIEPVTTV